MALYGHMLLQIRQPEQASSLIAATTGSIITLPLVISRSAARFTDMKKFGYVCTGGGAMVRFLAGKRLPLIEAMEKAGEREISASMLG